MKIGLLLALFWLGLVPAYAVDMTQPAQVTITVQDAAGHPLPQAIVTLGDKPHAVILSLSKNGQAEAEQYAPPDTAASEITWRETLCVTLAGYLPDREILYSFFPGARLEQKVTLQQSRVTRLHLRGPKGEPLAGVGVTLGGAMDFFAYRHEPTGYTDAQGNFVFTDAPVTSRVTLTGDSFRKEYPNAPEITATLTDAEMPVKAHPMRLTLVAPDGRLAAGWLVAPNAYVRSIYCWTGGLNGPPISVYGMGKAVKTDSAGAASFPQKEDHLVVISPQGAPFLYPVNPQTWPPGLHCVTLRLPPVRRTETGRLVFPDGRPAAGFPVSVAQAVTGGEQWRLDPEEPLGTLLTDADGRCALPQYFGTHYQYESRKPPLYAFDLADSYGSVLRDEGPASAPKPAAYKHVTLMFVDDQGKPLPEIGLSYEGGLSPVTDTRGVHLFLPSDTDRVVIKTQALAWKPLTKTLELPGLADLAFTIAMPQPLHLQPLKGALVDPIGQPVPGVSINLYGINPRPGSPNNEYLRFSTTTDAQGRFAFAAAPDSCEIDLYRYDADDQADLPGWIDPPVVTPQTRDMRVQLKPFSTGTVLALLPPSVTTEPKEIYLKSVPIGDRLPDFLFPIFDPARHTLRWNRIPPGRYLLTTGDAPALPAAAQLALPVTLTEGKETEIDLRGQTATFPPPIIPTVIRIYVYDGKGNGVRGATVTLWTDQQGWGRHFPADLTDDNGSVWLPLGRGQRGVAVVHAAGRMTGWAGLTGEEGKNLYFGIGPARTLTVSLKPLPLVNGKPPYDSRQVWLSPAGPMKPDEAQAVFSVLGLLGPFAGFLGDGPMPRVQLPKDSDGTWVAQDLPPWTYHLEVGSDVTLTDADPAVTEVPLETAEDTPR